MWSWWNGNRFMSLGYLQLMIELNANERIRSSGEGEAVKMKVLR